MYYSGYDQSSDHYTKIYDTCVFVELFALKCSSDDAVSSGEEEYPELMRHRAENEFEC